MASVKIKIIFGIKYLIIITAFAFAAYAADSALYNQKGLNELRGNRPGKAVEYFLMAVKINPAMKHYHNNLAAAYIRLGEYAKAEESLKKSLKLDINYTKALSNMAVVLFYMGRYSESYRYYKQAKRADGEYTDMRFESSRVSSTVKKLSSEKPDDENLKRINDYLENSLQNEHAK